MLRSRTDPPRYKVAADYCRSRWCYPCARARGALIASNLHQQIAGRSIKLITLTIRHSSQALNKQIDHLYKSITKLRLRKIWSDHVHGGAAVLEVHHTGAANGWHPHLHLLAEASYIDRRELAATWHSITRDSFIVDVRSVSDHLKASRYVTKYLSKPFGKGVIDRRGHLAEAMAAMHGRKLVMTWGTWRGLDLTQAPDDETGWDYVAGLSSLMDLASHGDPEARSILRAVQAAETASPRAPPFGAVSPGTVPADLLPYVYA